ncbi:MAG: efflux RND transporter periplasmic adaptor subunit [Kiritimatiellae bacterium]|nr:efflux RND transporter periplasmic adaptor subunit [Kiritimatiellia bacterium]
MTEEINNSSRSGRFLQIAVIAIGVLIVGLVLVLALGRKEVPEDTAEKAVPVRLMAVEPRTVPDMIVIPGRIEPFVEADLAVEKPGRIVGLTADKGDRVEAGQVLLRLDSRMAEAALKQAEIEHREAAKELERWKGLEKAGAVSASDFDSIKTRLDNAEVMLEQARVSLSQCEVRSPIAGIVDQRHVEEGEFANEGMPVFKVLDIDRVKLAVNVAERDVYSLKHGDDVNFRIAALSGQSFTGRASFVSSLAGRESNSFRAELLVANPGHLLKPGLIAEVMLVRRVRDDAIVLPLAAVVPQKGDHVVYTEKDGRAVRNLVRIEALIGSEVVLSEGIAPGDRVIIEGQRSVLDGALVEILE